MNSSENGPDHGVRTDVQNPYSEFGALAFELLDGLAEPFILLDSQLRFVYLNKEAEKLVGASSESILGLPLLEGFPACSVTTLPDKCAFALEGSEPNRFTIAFPAIGRWFDATAAPNRAGLALTFRDVTPEKRKEVEFRESEATLHSFYETSPIMMGVVELFEDDSDILHVYDNPATTKFFGIPPGSTSGRLASEIGAPPEAIEVWISRYRLSQRERRAIRFEYPHPAGDKELWLAATVSPIGVSATGRARFSYVTEEITERRAAESELKESERRMRDLVQGCPVGMIVTDVDGRVQEINPEAERILGRTREQIFAIRGADVTPTEWRAADQAAIKEASESGVSTPYEKEYTTPDGKRVPVLVGLSRLGDDRFYEATFILDLSVLRTKDQALRTSEERMRLSHRAAGIGVFEWDFREEKNSWNNEISSLLGLNPEKGQQSEEEEPHWSNVVHPEDLSFAQASMIAAVHKGGEFSTEWRSVSPEGKVRWIVARGYVYIGDDGKPQRMLGVTIDVTDQRTAELAKAESERRLALALEAGQLGFWDWDMPSGRVIRGGQFAEILGRSPDEIEPTVEGWQNLLHPDDVELTETALTDYLEDRTPTYECVHRLRHRDGSWRWILDRGRVVERDIDGKPVRMIGTQSDITATKLADEALRESEARAKAAAEIADHEKRLLDAVLDALPVGVIIADRDGKIIRTNPANTAIWGTHPNSSSWEEYGEWIGYWPETGEQIKGEDWAMARALRQGESILGELVQNVKFGSGERGYYINNAAPVRNADGEIIAGVVAELDVTDRLKLEKTLRESEARYRALAEVSPQAVWTSDPTGEITYINAWWFDFTGMSPEEGLGNGWVEAVHPDHRERVIREWSETLAVGKNWETEIPFRRADGEYRWHIARGLPIRDEQGRITMWAGIGLDIHDRLNAEATLRESEVRFRQLAESLPQLVWTAKADGSTEYYNERWYEYTGMTTEDLGKKLWTELLHPEDIEKSVRAWEHSVRTGDEYSIEYRLRGKDGCYRWFLGLGTPIKDQDGNVTRWFGTCTDIEAQKEMEGELERRVQERTNELNIANRELEGFAYSIAHDLRAPLRAIGGTSSILSEELGELLSDEHRRMLARQRANANKLGHLVDDLLRYAKLGRQPLSREEVDVSAMACEIGASVCESFAGRALRIDVEPGIKVQGDTSAIRLLLVNLIENAAKYSPGGGTISVGLGNGAFFVRDEGIGFEMEYAEKIFRPFERLHRDDEIPGTGIGLANVSRIVERHRGRIWAESELGKGSTFWVSIPD